MKRIVVLVNGPIHHDYRVLKTVETLSREHLVSLYYLGFNNDLDTLFNGNKRVTLYPIEPKNNLMSKLKRHSFFCFEYNYFINFLNDKKIDVVWANDLPMLYPGFCLAKINNAILIYDSHEIYTETINQFFPKKRKGLRGILFNLLISFMRAHGKQIERKYLPKVDHFITVNDSLLNYFEERYTIKNATVIKNLPSLSSSAAGEEVNFRALFNWSNSDKVLLYQGALNEGRGLRLIVRLMKGLPTNFKLVILGDGVLQSELKALSAELNVGERIKFLGFVPLKELPCYTRGADIGFNLLEDINLSKSMALPNKLFEYIHAGVPVVATDTIENRQVVEKYGVGRCCKNNIESLKSAVEEIIKLDYSEKLEKAQQEFNWEKQESVLLNIVNG